MVKSYTKIVTRKMRTRVSRFLAILAIIILGVTFITGISATAPNMKASVSAYFEDGGAPDIIVKAPTGLNEDKLAALEANDKIDKVTPLVTFDTIIEEKATRLYYLDLSDDSAIGRVELLEGRMPEKEGEVIAERSGSFIKSPEIGAIITHATKDYEVVGIVGNPWYFSKDKEVSEAGFGWLEMIIYLDIEHSPLPFYTDANIKVKAKAGLDTFSDEYKENVKKVKEQISDMKENDGWYLIDRQMNLGLVIFRENANKIDAIADVFPVFFVLVAALVVLTTMTRMVEEERMEIGSLKFLGYKNSKIAWKYLFYGLLASVVGSLIGILAGFRLLPGIIYSAFSAASHAPDLIWGFYLWKGILAFALMTAMIVITTLGAVANSLRETPAQLLQPKAPKPGKRILLERIPFIWNLLKFKYKSTMRNIFRYKKNLIMTLVGVAGSTGLMFVGFALRDSLHTLTTDQYEEIIKYDLSIKLKDTNYQDELEFVTFLDSTDGYLESYQKLGTATIPDQDVPVNLVVFKDSDVYRVNDFINIRERVKHVPLSLSNGIVINEGLARLESLEEGDTINFDDKDYVISGINENYMENYIFMSAEDYDIPFTPTHLLINGPGIENKSEDINSVLAFNSVTSLTFTSDVQENSAKPLEMMTILVVIIILGAGSLTIIVIYNLTNLNIDERRKEIATLKVLGYNDFETAGYIYREIFILTALGTVIGLGGGFVLHQYIIKLVDGATIMMGRSVNWYSFILAAALTFVFTAIVGLLMFWKIKKIDMNSSLKVVD